MANEYDPYLIKGWEPNPNPGHYGIPVLQREVATVIGGLKRLEGADGRASERLAEIIRIGSKFRAKGNPRWGETIWACIDPERLLDINTRSHIADALSVGYFLLAESSTNYAAGHPLGPSEVRTLDDVSAYLQKRLGDEADPLIQVINKSKRAQKLNIPLPANAEAVRKFRAEIESRPDADRRSNSQLIQRFKEDLVIKTIFGQ